MILIYGDSPTAHTGLGRVVGYIADLLRFMEKEFIVVGLNYYGFPHKYTYPILPVGYKEDIFGEFSLESIFKVYDITHIISCVDLTTYEVVFYQHVLPKIFKDKSPPEVFHYFPFDRDLRFYWLSQSKITQNKNSLWVTYTPPMEYEDFYKKQGIHFIPLPIPDCFHSDKFSDKVKEGFANKKVAIWNFKNQWNKAPDLAMLVWEYVYRKRPDLGIYLYMHTQRVSDYGYALDFIRNTLDYGKEYIIFPTGLSYIHPNYVEDSLLNEIYNYSLFGLCTSSMEGFCLPIFELLRIGKPVVVPPLPSFRWIFRKTGAEIFLISDYQPLERYASIFEGGIPSRQKFYRPQLYAERIFSILSNYDRSLAKAHQVSEFIKNELTIPRWQKEMMPLLEKFLGG